MSKEWQNKKELFEVLDVRELTGNFLPMVLKKAQITNVSEGLCIIQSFEPIPLYSALADLGFEYLTEKVSDNEYRVYFYRTDKKVSITPGGMGIPLKPTAIINFKTINNSLADIVVHFWELIWGKENPAISNKTRYLLSLANGVGAKRYRQATRELIKAYSAGTTIAELDELFSMFVWNGGVGTFASEIGPSSLFGAYLLIKKLKDEGKSRNDVMKILIEKFGEKNPEVSTIYAKKTIN